MWWIPEVVLGAAFAVVGGAARRWLILAGGLALVAGAALTTHQLGGSLVVLGAVAGLAPGILRIPPRPPVAGRLLLALDVAVAAAGAAAAVAAGLGEAPAAWAAGLIAGVGVVCAGWTMFELTAGEARRQVLWLIFGVCAAGGPVALFLVSADEVIGGPAVVTAVVAVLGLPLPASVAFAALAPRRVDVRVVISRVAVLAVMLLLIVPAYSGVVAVIEALAGARLRVGAQGLVVAGIALLFQPVLARVRAGTDEMLFGGRADPVRTLTRLGSQLTAGASPQEWLDTLRAALGVQQLQLRSDDQVVTSGKADAEWAREVTPLRTGEETVGELVVVLHPDQLALTGTTRAVLALVSTPLAQALHAVRLTEQLQVSRGRVVVALEEERRRVRRDLHDGLGPTLTGIAYSTDAAVNLMPTDPGQAAVVLRTVRADAGEAIAEVRRIVYGLRPKALDELGLIGAVRQRVTSLRAADGRAMTVDVVVEGGDAGGPGELPELPAAVEVVAYRVAVEGVTNVARHAGVDAAAVRFDVLPSALVISVTDAGVSSPDWRPGVGLDSMRERVEQLGGVLTVTGGSDGARVRAEVPLTP
jgi:signal transduction histidine kinase